MAFIVEMVRGDSENSREHCSCSIFSWTKILAVAEKFGWGPEGTLPDEWARKYTIDYDNHFKPSYDWAPWAYCKRFSDSDAKAMSKAPFNAVENIQQGSVEWPLQNKPSMFIEDASLIEQLKINFSSSSELIGIAQFAANGGFVFAIDD